MAIALPRDVAVRTRIKETNFASLSGVQKVAEQNDDRIALLFSIPAQTSVQVTTVPTAGSSQGMQLSGNMPRMLLTMQDVGGLVSQPWYGQGNLAGLTVIEVIYLPED